MQPAWPSTASPQLFAAVARSRRSSDRMAVPKSVRSAQIAFQRGKQPGHGMGVMPDVGAGALAAADALPAVEAAVGEPVAGRGGQNRRVGERAVQEPVRQRRVVPGVVPQPRLPVQPRRSSRPRTRPRRPPTRTAWRRTARRPSTANWGNARRSRT